jgi:hypothetical protein
MKRGDKKQRPPQAYHGPVITHAEIDAAIKQHGPVVADAYLRAEALRRRLARLGSPANKEEADIFSLINLSLKAVDERLRAKSPNYDLLRSCVKEAEAQWPEIVFLRNSKPAQDARTAAKNGRIKQAKEQAKRTRDDVRALEAKLRTVGKPERAITKTIMLELGKDRKTVEKYRTKTK